MKASNVTYVRWQRDESRRARDFPPLAADHPAYLLPCAICTDPLGNGCEVALVVIGPDDDDCRHSHDAGLWYPALSIVLHAPCVLRFTDADLDVFVTELVPDPERAT